MFKVLSLTVLFSRVVSARDVEDSRLSDDGLSMTTDDSRHHNSTRCGRSFRKSLRSGGKTKECQMSSGTRWLQFDEIIAMLANAGNKTSTRLIFPFSFCSYMQGFCSINHVYVSINVWFSSPFQLRSKLLDTEAWNTKAFNGRLPSYVQMNNKTAALALYEVIPWL